MKITIVVGSSRSDSQSLKVAKFIHEIIEARLPGKLPAIVDAKHVMPCCWGESDDQPCYPLHEQTLQTFAESDAVVIVVPEWGGMAPPAVKNLLLACDTQLAHKPCLLVGVSSGLGGSYPLMELRASGYKNTKLCYLPEHLIVRNVEAVLNPGEPNGVDDTKLRERLFYCLRLLSLYAGSLKQVRDSESIDLFRYPYGM